MKTYEFRFKGLWISPTVIVVAKNREQAEEYAKAEIKANNFDPETLEFVEERKFQMEPLFTFKMEITKGVFKWKSY